MEVLAVGGVCSLQNSDRYFKYMFIISVSGWLMKTSLKELSSLKIKRQVLAK